MKSLKFLFLIISLLLVCCSKDETPVPKPETQQQPELKPDEPEEPMEPQSSTYLTFNSRNLYATDEYDNYVVLHDQDGNLMDYRPFESNEQLVFKAIDTSLAKTKTLTASLIRISLGEHATFNMITSYPGIELGSVLHSSEQEQSVWESPNFTRESKKKYSEMPEGKTVTNVGIFNISVKNVNGVARFGITNDRGSPNRYDVTPRETESLEIESLTLELESKHLMYLEDLKGRYKYIFFETPPTNSEIILNFEEFLQFDEILTLEFPEHQELYGNSRVIPETNSQYGLGTGTFISWGDKTSAQLGYIDGMFQYGINIHLVLDQNYTYYYSNRTSTLPTGINPLPKPSFSIENEDMSHFKYSTDLEHMRSVSIWSYIIDELGEPYLATSWLVYGTNSKQPIIGKLPNEIVNKYPKFNLDKIAHERTDLITQGGSYSNHMKSWFGLEPSSYKGPHEYATMRTTE